MGSPIPLYHLISSAIRRRVEDGEYPVGSALPTEDEFTQEFGVSRATIRQAVQELVQAGMLSRRRGSGTFVVPGATQRLGQRFRGSLTDLMNETRRAGTFDVQVDRSTAVPAPIAARLGLSEPIGTVVRRTRTMDDRPFAYTINYLPDAHGELLDEAQLRSESLMALLENAGVHLSGARQSIQPQLADIDLGDRLGLPYAGAPVLFVERLVWGPDEAPVELAHTWYRGDAYEYTVTFDLDPHSRSDAMGKFA